MKQDFFTARRLTPTITIERIKTDNTIHKKVLLILIFLYSLDYHFFDKIFRCPLVKKKKTSTIFFFLMEPD
jgi:hypothetical protein